MKPIHTGILILLIAVAASCKKKEYPAAVTNGDSVFFFKGKVDGSPVSVAAGINGYYMYSSYQQDSSGVYNFTGKLKQSGCSSNCPVSLNVGIRDAQQLQQGAAATPSAFIPGDYLFAYDNTEYRVDFHVDYNGTPANTQWDYGDGSAGGDAFHVYKKSGSYQVRLTIADVNGYVSSISNTVKVGLPANTCRTEISMLNVSGKVVSLAQTSSGQGNLKYLWHFGDGTSSTAADPAPHSYPNPGAYPVSLRVTDENNEVAYANYNVITQSDLASRAPNFRAAAIVPLSPLNLSSAGFSWTDASGRIYRSDRIVQPSSSYFRIISVEDYSPNEKGERTKKIQLSLNCILSDGATTIMLSNAEAVICVAYR